MDDEFNEGVRKRMIRQAPQVAARAKLVKFQNFIPSHWFSSAASECMQMFIHGHFYGCISVAQAYVEALGKYLSGVHEIRTSSKPTIVWERLSKAEIVSADVASGAKSLFLDRNDFHHLNKNIEQDVGKLEQRALYCLNVINEIEGEVFSFSLSEGRVSVNNPQYWPPDENDSEFIQIFVRNIQI
ncbi:MAG: hypothetical protein P1V13_00415 [Rhizobiaceae bacterium]|nr:hypothetical protein [Rhizobiaceae bacterium]|tara:strand:+ start:12156 stop:12710 length:555 start_codon:yes stop_codon:yes gene_type:complete